MFRNKTINDLKALGHSLPPRCQEDLVIILGGSNPQHIVFTDIPYFDHNNNKKIIVSAVYNVVHQTLPSLLPTLLPPLQSPPAYEMRDIPGKGKGMVATRDIAFGEIVIIERPILVSPRLMVHLDSVTGFQTYAKRSMDQEDWIKFSDLVNVKDDTIPEFHGIRNTNAFEIHLQKGKENYSAVFLELSRLNHSCGPNLRNIWDPHLFTFSVQAVRPIRAGQELTVSYINPFLPYADRQSSLQSAYKFKCKCPYCAKSSPTSDQDRRETSKSDDMSRDFELFYNNLIRPGLVPRHVGRQKSKLLLNNLISGLVVITKEGIESMAAVFFYVCLMKLSGALGDKKKFKEWGFKAILSSLKYVETDGEEACREVEQWIDWVKDPEKKFPEWGRYQ